MHRFLLLPGAALIASALTLTAASAAPAASDASVRLPAVTGRPAAGFVMVTSPTADVLTGVTSEKAGRIEMHSVNVDNGVMRMRQQTAMEVPAGGMLHMAPGGNHLMLFDLITGIKDGDTMPLTLSFKSGATVKVDAKVTAAGTTPPNHGDHKH